VFAATFALELRLRAVLTACSAVAMIGLCAAVGALYPAVGDALGTLKLPKGFGELIGGGDFSALPGLLKSEVITTLGPLVIAGAGISSASATIAGEEESRVLATVLAQPVGRVRLLLAKASAVAVVIATIAAALAAGLGLADLMAGGHLRVGDILAQAVHLGGLGLFFAALALALGGATGRKGLAVSGAAAIGVVMFLVNGFAPVIPSVRFLRYGSAFYYANGSDPLTTGFDAAHLLVLLLATGALVAVAALGLRGRDLRG
jgi:ABC-2 type transport system permease protein